MEFAILTIFLASIFKNTNPASTELQSLLIFTTATADDREIEELRGKWSKLGTFESAFSSLINGGPDQQNFWTILLSRGEPDVLFRDIEKAIQADDRTKVIVGRPNGIIDRIFLSPFCWRRGATEQMAFVMCNGKLEFPIDERGWEIDEKVEANGAMRRDELAGMQRRSVWVDLLPGVRMATASPLQKRATSEQTSKKVEINDGKQHSKLETEEEDKNEEKEEKEEENEDEQEQKSIEKTGDEENVEEELENKEMDEEKKMDDAEEEDFSGQNEGEQKRLCRYRISCYARTGITLSEKQRERHQSLLGGKLAPQKGKKSIMKDAADAAVRKMKAKEAEGKVLREKYERDGEKMLADFWTELERKNKCKYRKSCYQTGVVPEIGKSPLVKWLGSQKTEKEDNKEDEEVIAKNFDEMNEYERKHYCQYRRSCYEKGIRPKIENQLEFMKVGVGDAVKGVQKWWSGLEKRKMEKKEREKVEGHEDDEKPFTKLGCKYRKSCYESGKLPEHLQGPKRDPEEHAAKVLGGKKVPTSVKELKLFCRYRKSCYVASADKEMEKLEQKRKIDDLAAVVHNETKGEVVEGPRNPRPNSDSHANTVQTNVLTPNGREKKQKEMETMSEKKETKKIKFDQTKGEENEEEGCGEEDKKEKIYAEKSNRRRKLQSARRLANPKVEAKQENKEEKVVEEKREKRKNKRYTVVDMVAEEGPVPFVEKKKDERRGETEKSGEEEEVVVEKQKERRTKKYTITETPKEEPIGKIWAKKSAKVAEGKMGKLECRYRKSCYKSGIVPEWAEKTREHSQWTFWASIARLFEEKERDEIEDILGWRGMSEKERWFRCKYRKSCYERMNRKAGSIEGIVVEKGKENKKSKEPMAKVAKKEKSAIEQQQQHAPALGRNVDMAMKLQCKYRKSCYESGDGIVPRMMERIVDSVEAGPRNWTGEGRCNPWRISCRQALGLPIREKAPIGPNGKRLCRKRKPAEGS